MKEVGLCNVKLLDGSIECKMVYEDENGDNFIKIAGGGLLEVYKIRYSKNEYEYEQV